MLWPAGADLARANLLFGVVAIAFYRLRPEGLARTCARRGDDGTGDPVQRSDTGAARLAPGLERSPLWDESSTS